MCALALRRVGVGMLTTLLMTVSGPIARAAAGPTSCVLSSDLSSFHCYAPTQVGQAERDAHFRPINPTAIVAAASHLPLYRVLLDPIPGPNETGISGGQMTYVYGTPPPHLVAPKLFAPGKPRFVIVQEMLGHGNFGKQVTIWRGYVRKWHAFTPWHFVAVGPIPGIALQVLSNLRKAQVRRIGEAIIAAARQRD